MRERVFHRSFYMWLMILLSVTLFFALGSTRTVYADINSADEPEYFNIATQINVDFAYNGEVIKSAGKNEQKIWYLNQDDRKLLVKDGEIPLPSYTLSDGGSVVTPVRPYYLKWSIEKQQLYLTDKSDNFIWFSKEKIPETESPVPIQFSKIKMGFYYYADNNNDLIGTATITNTLENNKFTINVPEKPTVFTKSNDYYYTEKSGNYNPYKGDPITLDKDKLSLSKNDDKENTSNFIFYRNIYLSIPNVKFYQTLYLNKAIYLSKIYSIPSNASKFEEYNILDKVPKDAKFNETWLGYYIKKGYILDTEFQEEKQRAKVNGLERYNYGKMDGNDLLGDFYYNTGLGLYSNGYITSEYYYETENNPKTSSQDVLLHTNLGDKIIRVEGDIPSKDIKVDVPAVDGYKKGSVTASIDESGKITLKDPDGNVNDEKSLYDYVKGTDDSGSSSTPTKTEPSIPSHSSSSVHKVEPTITKKNQLVSTAICKGYVSLYKISGTNISKVTDQALSAFSDWQSDEMVTINGEKYYRVATNKWVKDQNVYVYQPLDTVVKTKQNLVYMKNDEFNNITNRALAANSSWKIDRIAYLEHDSTPYYRVSTNEFVRKDDINIGN